MDMDLDAPLPEELEWLEGGSYLDEEHEYLQEDDFYPVDESHEEQQLLEEVIAGSEQRSPGASSFTSVNLPTAIDPELTSCVPPTDLSPHKRFRPDEIEPPSHREETSIEGKRARIVSVDRGVDYCHQVPPNADNYHVQESFQENILSRHASKIDGDCFPITSPDGERVYAKMRGAGEVHISKKFVTGVNHVGLIREPITSMFQKVEQDAFLKALQVSSEGSGDMSLPQVPLTREQLWVDKYAPNSFTELLSDEQTNREQWDSCVYGSDIRSTSDNVMSSLRRHSSASHHPKSYAPNSFTRNNGLMRSASTQNFRKPQISDHENGDVHGVAEMWNKTAKKNTGPPLQKMLLLCGPPGFGKTTLAHVVARHCGYRVVELNASDDRSASMIESKILDCVQMNSINDDLKPKCLVIDEIDGSLADGKGAVEVLLRMLSADKSNTEKENGRKDEESRRSSKKRCSSVLSRPVICICNDLYAPALRQLRQAAKVHQFSQPAPNRIVSRLRWICNKEGAKVSSIALTSLADYAECDIRSCLNTLQFLKKKKDSLNSLEICSHVMGRKDTTRTLFDIWKEIFQKKKVKKGRSGEAAPVVSAYGYLDDLIWRCGDHDMIMDGIYENILKIHYHDPLMQKTVRCLDSIGISDVFHDRVMRTQQMILNAYQPSVVILISRLVSQVEKPTVEWPRAFHRYRMLFSERAETVRAWRSSLPSHLYRHVSVESFARDTVSQLLHILSPPSLRPAAAHMLSQSEKTVFDHLVSTMVTYSITYRSHRPSAASAPAAAITPELIFEPPLMEFVRFKDYQSCRLHVLPQAAKQVLIHEVEKMRIVQHSASAVKENEGPPAKPAPVPDFSTRAGESGPARGKRKVRNFFDQFRKTGGRRSADDDDAGAGKDERNSSANVRPLLFKFNEGFTNAVKRHVKMREFLL